MDGDGWNSSRPEPGTAFPEYPDHPLLRLIYYITWHALYGAIAVGVPGNLMTLTVASMPHNRKLSISIYMMAMSVADTIFLLTQGIGYARFRYFRGTIGNQARVLEMNVHYFITYTSAMTSGLLLAEMSVDRFIVVRYPMVAKRLCNASKAKKTVLITCIVFTLIHITSFFSHAYVMDPISTTEILVVSIPSYPGLEVLFTNFQLVFGSILPSVIIIFSNIGIIITVKRASAERAKMAAASGDETREKQLTSMLIMVSAAYLLTTIPLKAFFVILSIPSVSSIYKFWIPYWNLLFNIYNGMVYTLWCFNYAVNFYLYCLAGGKRYREDAKVVLKKLMCCCQKTQQNKIYQNY